MYVRAISLSFLISICASTRIIDYGNSGDDLEQIFYALKATKETETPFNIWLMEKRFRERTCEQVFRSAYFSREVKFIDKNSNNWNSYIQLKYTEQSSSLELHYRTSDDNKDLIAAYPAIDMHVQFANSKGRELMFPCLGRRPKSEKLVDLFISSGFRKDVFFVFRRRTKSRDIIPMALFITSEPQSIDMDQYDLERFYISQRKEFEQTHPDSTDDGDFKKLTFAEIFTLVNIVFSSSFIRHTKEIKYENKEDSINFELQRSFIKLAWKAPDSGKAEQVGGSQANTETARSLRLGKKISHSQPSCFGSFSFRSQKMDKKKIDNLLNEQRTEDAKTFVDVIEVTALGAGRKPVTYAMGRGYDNKRSVFIFKKLPEDGKMVLFAYLYNVAILKKL